jgi:hypothetical protein
MDWRHIGELLAAARANAPELINLCVWTKPNAGMGSFYRSQHELVFVFKSGAGSYRNNVQLGYCRPPLSSRFRPGASGNLRGRLKGVKSLAAVVAATLGERIAVTENGHRKRITRLEAAVKQLVNRAASGEACAMQLLLALVQASEARPPQADANRRAEGDEIVLRELQRRLTQDAS